MGIADKISKVISCVFRSSTTDTGTKPNDKRGIKPSKLIYIASPPTLGTNPEWALCVATSSKAERLEKPYPLDKIITIQRMKLIKNKITKF